MALTASQNEQVDEIGVEHIAGLYRYAMAVSRSPAEAEDLVQETYVRALQAAKRLKPDSNIKSWLFTILRNLWLNRLRMRRGRPQLIQIEGTEWEGESIVEPAKDSLDLYVSKVQAEQVKAAIQDLHIEFREVILLREYEDLSYQEISQVLGCPVGTVTSRLARARAKLRELLTVRLSMTKSCKKAGNRGL